MWKHWYLQYCSPEEDGAKGHADRLRRFYNLIVSSLDTTRLWAERIPGFNDICREDQELLINSASLELFVLRIASR